MLKAGHGSSTITVVPGEPMGGYADRSGGIDALIDPLEASAITLAGGGSRFALVTLDVVCVNTDVVEQIRRAVCAELAVDSCWVAATHTHSSPDAGCRPGGGTTDPHLAERLVQAGLAAVRRALEGERPTELATVRVPVAGLAERRTAEPSDEMAVPIDALCFSFDGALQGLLVVSPVHPTVFGADSTAISADLNGSIRRALVSRGVPWAVVATGAAGDISTRHTRRERSPEELDRLGSLVADALEPAVAARGASAPSSPPRPVSERLELPAKPPGELPDVLEPVSAGSAPADSRWLWVLRQGIQIAEELAQAGRTTPYEVEIAVLPLGGVALVAIPGELFLSLGEAIRDRLSPAATAIVIGYANGYVGYLPERDAGTCYEVLASAVALGSGERVVDSAVALARKEAA